MLLLFVVRGLFRILTEAAGSESSRVLDSDGRVYSNRDLHKRGVAQPG